MKTVASCSVMPIKIIRNVQQYIDIVKQIADYEKCFDDQRSTNKHANDK